MPCACRTVVRGFERGTLSAFVVRVDGVCAITFDDRCVVFPTEDAARAAAIEHGFADWELAAVTV